MAGSKRIQGITIEIGGDTSKLVSSLKNVDTQIRKTQTTLKDVNKLLKMDPGNTELLRQKQKLLNDAIGQTKDRLTELRHAQDGVAKGTDEWDALQREIIETEQDLKGLEGELKEFGSVTTQKLKVVGEKFQDVGSKIESAGRALSRVSTAAAGAIGGIAKIGYDAVQSADELNTLAKQTGVSTDELQKWGYAAELVDVDVDTITSSMKRMKKNLDSNSDAFEELGVKTKDGSGQFRDATDIFYDTLEALSQIDNETERDVVAMDLFGRNADELAGIIDDGGKALRKYGEEAENLGLIIDGDTLDKLNEANDTIDKLKATIGGSLARAGATIAQTFAPAMEKVVALIEQVAEKIRNLTPEQAELIVKILAVVAALSPVLIIVGKLVKVIGFVMANLSTISAILGAILSPIGLVVVAILALVAAFVYFYNTNEEFRNKVQEIWENVKTAVVSAFETVKAWIDAAITWLAPILEAVKGYLSAIWEFVQTIIGIIVEGVKAKLEEHKTFINAVMMTIKMIITTAFTVIKNSIQTTLKIIQTVFTTVFNVIKSIVQAVTSALKGDWKGCMDNLKNAASTAINGIKSIFSSLKSGLSGIFNDLKTAMLNWGKEMIENFINGIKSKIEEVKNAMSEVAGGVSAYVHFSQPDVGPLSDFNTYAPDMMKLFAQGIMQNASLVTDAVAKSFNLKPAIINANNQNALMNNPNAALMANNNNQPISVNIALEGDANRIFRLVSVEANRNQQITGKMWAY